MVEEKRILVCRNKKGLSFSSLLYKYNANNHQASMRDEKERKVSNFVDVEAADKREKDFAGLLVLGSYYSFIY